MTVIAFRDGILAADSWCMQGPMVCGETRKLHRIKDEIGGGWAAGSGHTAAVSAMIDAINTGGRRPSDNGISILWVKADRSVWVVETASIFEIVAPFHAIGSGMQAAMGAMAVGATAIQAVGAACQVNSECGGEVQWVQV